ncbi:hypothetical protein D083_0644 [Dickeya solani RNS 08.23.3.1.A]|nr:hypothetical protein D083_0644 [Dickeya solani RNS 08.23.3.1.A]
MNAKEGRRLTSPRSKEQMFPVLLRRLFSTILVKVNDILP